MMAFVGNVGLGHGCKVVGSSVSTSKGSRGSFGVVRTSRRAILPMMMTTDYNALGEEMENDMADPVQVIDRALTDFGDQVAIAFSGAEDVVLVEYAHRTRKPFRVFALDTGRLHPETYRFFAEVEKHYGIRIEYTFPDKTEVEDLVNEKGLFSFYEDGHQVRGWTWKDRKHSNIPRQTVATARPSSLSYLL